MLIARDYLISYINRSHGIRLSAKGSARTRKYLFKSNQYWMLRFDE